tara:strand:- start:8515 stop:9279 length:765 start_codon:yes stop_codon:yes gene_type:complete
LQRAAPAEGETALPGFRRLQETPSTISTFRFERGQRIDERLLLTEFQKRDVCTGVAVAFDALCDSKVGESDNFGPSFVILPDQIRKKLHLIAPLKKGSKTEIKTKRFSNVLNPKLRARGGENESSPGRTMFLNFGNDFGIGEPWEPFFHKLSGQLFESFPLHPPEITVENPLHSSGSQQLIERKKQEKHESQNSSPSLLLKDIAPEDQLGIPRDDGLIEIKKDGLRHVAHGILGSGLAKKWNFNLFQLLRRVKL